MILLKVLCSLVRRASLFSSSFLVECVFGLLGVFGLLAVHRHPEVLLFVERKRAGDAAAVQFARVVL